MTVTKEDQQIAADVIEALHGAFVTGSFLVSPSKANDIDIVVSEAAWLWYCDMNSNYGYETQHVGNHVFTKQEVENESDNYGRSDDEMFELVSHWRHAGVNIIVIRDVYYAAYKAASYLLESMPRKYATREERVDAHQRCKKVIRDLLSNSAEGDELPW